jgi:hypothetical protein
MADTIFKATDTVLQQLWEQRRAEVVRLQQRQAQQLQDLENRGQARIRTFRASLPSSLLDTIDAAHKADSDAATVSKSVIADTRAKLIESAPTSLEPFHPGLANGQLIAPSSVGWFSPYYATLHGSDGSVYWQGYNPSTFKLWDSAWGSGPGWFGTGAASFTVYLDWWFWFRAPDNRYYNYIFYVPFYGFYIVFADDGWFTSKEAHARIDLSMQGYQYNWKGQTSTNVLDIDGQNINDNYRFDGTRITYYSDLLGADTAYVLLSASFYVYARGDGSNAELNFNDGTANYVGVPWVYVV